MNRLIVNMAVVKVNWDQAAAAPFLDNYLPLVLYTLKEMAADEVSTHDFKARFEEVADFRVPHNVALVLLNRAMKKYGAIKRSRVGVYSIDRSVLPEDDYLENRRQQERAFKELSDRFISYCKSEFGVTISEEEAGRYFFEILYQIAPRLFSSAMMDSEVESSADSSHWKYGYLVSRFISYVNERDQQSLDIVLSFVRGAMLTETFYYQAPEDVQSKIRDVSVYLDTSLLLDIFGFAPETQYAPARELVEMLRELAVPLRCFAKTRGEIDAILHATSLNAQRFGRVRDARPGSVGDYFNSIGSSSSDIEVERNRVDAYLEKYGIEVVDAPAYLGKYGIDEAGLDAAIKARIPYQPDDSRARDVDCIAAVFRLRQGKIRRKLLECKAIFVTKNSDLASASTKFFNEQYGHSDTPLCIPDQVFTTLVWLKTAKKVPDLPRERVVANCFAAMQPSEEMWRRYASEARKLLEQGTITESDYELLVHSTDSRLHLMNLTFGDSEKIVGTVEEILERSRQEILRDTLKENEKLRQMAAESDDAARVFREKVHRTVRKFMSAVLFVIASSCIFYGLTATWPERLGVVEMLPVVAIAMVVVLTVLNLLLGTSLRGWIHRFSNYVADTLVGWLEK